jgi:bis(5'-nucleosidyl)-tetraphosphatase
MKRDFSFGIIPMYRGDSGIELLLIQHQEGHWAFPKGHAEGAETPLESAKREFEEETGISQFGVDEITTFSEEYEVEKDHNRYHKTVTYFPAFAYTQLVTPQEKEIKSFGWFSFEDAMKRVTFPVTQKMLQEFKPYYDERNSDNVA